MTSPDRTLSAVSGSQREPMTAESPHPAPWLRRVVARLVDAAVVLPLGWLLAQASKADGQTVSAGAEDLPTALFVLLEAAGGGVLVWFAYEAVALSRWGRTLGKAAVGIRVVPAALDEVALIPWWGRWVQHRHLREERRLSGRIEQLHSDTPPRWVWGGLIAAVRDDGSGTQRLEAAQRHAARRLDHLQLRHTIRPGGLRAVTRTAALAAFPLALVVVAGLVVEALPDHQIVLIAALVMVAAMSIATSGLVGHYRGLHDLIAPTAVVRA